MQHVMLKAGGWVDLRPPAEVPERLRRPVRRLQMALAASPAFADVVKDATTKGVAAVSDISDEQAAAMVTQMGDSYDLIDQLNDRLVISRVMGWSFGPDVTLDALQDLPGAAYDELRALCADGALDAGLDTGPSQDENSPTVPSAA
ncbi:hypothetical protein ACFC1T_02225 [Kitasatospora sp. NPDC056076]|uniref:hypothetical protein n=1 Tax=Kitasatospora sp. NPDC056076 TaxID=3345703 RepID=UPI0035DF1B6F